MGQCCVFKALSILKCWPERNDGLSNCLLISSHVHLKTNFSESPTIKGQ